MLIGTYQLKLNSKCTFEKVQRILHFPLLMSESKYISVDLVCVDWSSLVQLTINISPVRVLFKLAFANAPPAGWSIFSLHCHKHSPEPLLTCHFLPVTSHSWEAADTAQNKTDRGRDNSAAAVIGRGGFVVRDFEAGAVGVVVVRAPVPW